MNQLFKTLFFCWICIFIQIKAAAQACGTEPTPEQIEYLTQTRHARQAFDMATMAEDRYGASLHWIPLQFHECLPNNSAFPALYDSDITEFLSDLNTLFSPYRIQFYECGIRTTFVSSTLHSFDISEEPQLVAYDVPNVINIYAFGTVTSGTSTLAGYSYLPPSADRIVLSKAGGTLFNSKVFLHEMGHYLGLYHTHGKTNTGTTDELVNGTNCLAAGDDVCDTPADPNQIYSTNSACVYLGTALDLNGHPYLPDVGNHMSYAPSGCRNHFSVGQMNRMTYTALHDRNYLVGCDHPQSCDFPITELPVVFEFETGLDGWTNKYYESFGSFVDFINGTGPTPEPNTGPDQAYSGTGYIYLDGGSSDQNGASSVLMSPCIDLRGLASPKVSFKYHAYGVDIGGVGAQVSLDGGQTFQGPAPDNAIFYVTGDQGNNWHSVTCDLSAYKTAAALQIRLIASGGQAGEVAFDSIAIYNDPGNACNLSLTSEFLDISCHGANNGQIHLAPFGNFVAPVTYSWSNGGNTNTISNLSPGLYTVTATSANGCSVIATLPVLSPSYLYANTTQTNVLIYGRTTGSISTQVLGGWQPYSYLWSNGETTANLSNLGAGTYTVTVTDQGACTTTRTVVLTQPVITCSSYFSVFPWSSSIDQTLGIFQQVSGTDNFNWTRQTGSTPTSQTGPDAAYHGTHYWYTKASGGNAPNKSAALKTGQCLSLNALTNPVFEFYYHMYGNQTGSISVAVSLDNEVTWTTIWTLSGNQGNQWSKASINLLPYRTDHTKLRITGITGAGSRSDMAIDALYVGEAGNNQYLVEQEILQAPDMTVYPNPSTGIFELRMDANKVCERVEIFSPSGQLVWEEAASSSFLTFDLSDQLPGCYYLRVQSGTDVQVFKLMLMH